jgi:hypothetical protein
MDQSRASRGGHDPHRRHARRDRRRRGIPRLGTVHPHGFSLQRMINQSRFRVRRGLSGASDPRRLPDDVDADAAAGRTGQAGHASRQAVAELGFSSILGKPTSLHRYSVRNNATELAPTHRPLSGAPPAKIMNMSLMSPAAASKEGGRLMSPNGVTSVSNMVSPPGVAEAMPE